MANFLYNVTNTVLADHLGDTRPATNANCRLSTVTTMMLNNADLSNNGNHVFNAVVNTLVVNALGGNLGVLGMSDFCRRIIGNVMVLLTILVSEGGGWT